ncbi:hypothetical protein TNIN_91681 [Trichonephila inaurata madagascariensis]|uniref:Uncharacterized protein n=1 Tax=Trichonephila inaurata madagascariensis TaxID=2747483 RepID=A0A8X7BPA0_9ARAC|nr:hypothetical protein TNIN_91681 [Trichonephila inaurata madagascariensis]
MASSTLDWWTLEPYSVDPKCANLSKDSTTSSSKAKTHEFCHQSQCGLCSGGEPRQPVCGKLQNVSRLPCSRLSHPQFSLGEKMDPRLYPKGARHTSDTTRILFTDVV